MTIPIFPTLAGRSWPIMRTPTWSVLKQPAISGKETRVPLWSFPRYRYQFAFDVLRSNVNTEIQGLIGFVNSVGGSALPFYYDDPNDDAATDQGLGIGDGSTTAFQLVRAYGGFTEPVQSPNVITNVKINGTPTAGYTLGAGGIVNFTSAPGVAATISWTGSFYWLCRFDDDTTEFSQFNSTMFELKKLSFTTVKL